MPTLKAGSILVNTKTNQIGLVYRPHTDDICFPKGHLEAGETLIECAIRETEEETMRANHLYSTKEVQTQLYTTPRGETCETHMYISIDDGPTSKDIPLEDREELRWVPFNEVENSLSYRNLKELWQLAKPQVQEILDKNN